MDILDLLERAHGMSVSDPAKRETLYARAADEIRELRVEAGLPIRVAELTHRLNADPFVRLVDRDGEPVATGSITTGSAR